MIEIKKVDKEFNKKKRQQKIFSNLNVSFDDYGLIAIIGQNGSGKTTLFNMIAGLDNDYSGLITINGKNIENGSISYLMQDNNLYENLSVLDNLSIYNDVTETEIEKKLEQFKIQNLKNKKVNKLSGGEKRRVSIIKAILKNPQVLLCDEPTSSLDKENSIIIMDTLKELSKEMLVIYSCHDENLVEYYSDSIYRCENCDLICLKNSNDIKKKDIIKESHVSISNIYKKKIVLYMLLNNKNKIIIPLLVFLFLIILICLAICNYDVSHVLTDTMRKEKNNTIIEYSNDEILCNIYTENNKYLNFVDYTLTDYAYYDLPIANCFYSIKNAGEIYDYIGNIPNEKNEIMIYQIFAEGLIHYGFTSPTGEVIKYQNINELLNKEIVAGSSIFKVTGIIKNNLDKFTILKKDSSFNTGNSEYEDLEKYFYGKIEPYISNVITTEKTINELNNYYDIWNKNLEGYGNKIYRIYDYDLIEKKLEELNPAYKGSVLHFNKDRYAIYGTYYNYSVKDFSYTMLLVGMIIKYIIPLLIIVILLIYSLLIRNLLEKNNKYISMMRIDGFNKKEIINFFSIKMFTYNVCSALISTIIFIIISKIISVKISSNYYFYFNPLYITKIYYSIFIVFIFLLYFISIILIKYYYNKINSLVYLKNN